MRTVWTVLFGLAAALPGASPATACGCCGCCRGAPVAWGRVVTVPTPFCCQLPAAPAAPTQVAADDKKDDKAADKDQAEAEIRENLAKLPPEDRKLAEEQKYCVIEDDNRLGEMGVPIKLMVKGQPVFICCKGCRKAAEGDPDKTLAKVKELKAKAKAEDKK
jgi:hypothetical protein